MHYQPYRETRIPVARGTITSFYRITQSLLGFSMPSNISVVYLCLIFDKVHDGAGEAQLRSAPNSLQLFGLKHNTYRDHKASFGLFAVDSERGRVCHVCVMEFVTFTTVVGFGVFGSWLTFLSGVNSLWRQGYERAFSMLALHCRTRRGHHRVPVHHFVTLTTYHGTFTSHVPILLSPSSYALYHTQLYEVACELSQYLVKIILLVS